MMSLRAFSAEYEWASANTHAMDEIVLWLKKKDLMKYENVILRMGEFHLTMNFWGAIGHLMKVSGIEDVLIEAAVCLPRATKKIMAGKDHYAMLKAHALIESAMLQLLWKDFESWASEDDGSLKQCHSCPIK